MVACEPQLEIQISPSTRRMVRTSPNMIGAAAEVLENLHGEGAVESDSQEQQMASLSPSASEVSVEQAMV